MKDEKMDAELRAAAQTMAPPAGAEARVAERLAATLASSPPLLSLRGKIAAVLVAGAVVGAVFFLQRPSLTVIADPEAPMPAPQLTALSNPVVPPLSVSPPLRTPAKPHAYTAPQVALPVTPPIIATEPPITTPPIIPPPRPDTLAEEQQILEHARAAFDRGDTNACRTSLATYDQRFAQGELGEERDALWIYVLAREGHADEARSRLTAFERAHPASPIHNRLRAAIEEGEMP